MARICARDLFRVGFSSLPRAPTDLGISNSSVSGIPSYPGVLAGAIQAYIPTVAWLPSPSSASVDPRSRKRQKEHLHGTAPRFGIYVADGTHHKLIHQPKHTTQLCLRMDWYQYKLPGCQNRDLAGEHDRNQSAILTTTTRVMLEGIFGRGVIPGGVEVDP